MLVLSNILAFVPLLLPLILIGLAILVPLLIFVVYPKLRDSRIIKDLSKQLDEERDTPETTGGVISNIEKSEKDLGRKKKEQQKSIKQSEKISEEIDEFLGKRSNK